MKELLLKEIINNQTVTTEYINSISNRYDNFIQYTQLPQVNLHQYIDSNNLPVITNNLYNNTFNIISQRQNYIINLDIFKSAGFLSSLMIHSYFKQCIKNDTHINTILYIDTNLLVEDYKKLMDKTLDSVSPRLVHSLDVLYKEIEEAEFVFWDKFTMLNSNYALSKIYEILTIRYRNCLGNIFYITGGETRLRQVLGQETLSVMNLTSNELINLENETPNYIYKRSDIN